MIVECCPYCGEYMERPRVALSRVDNRTYVCPDCGVREALGIATQDPFVEFSITHVIQEDA